MTRLRDIARQAGVAANTVSKALRDAPDLSPATKARIRLLAQQLGYVPDSAARTLSLIHISEPTRLLSISYAVFCLKQKTIKHTNTITLIT